MFLLTAPRISLAQDVAPKLRPRRCGRHGGSSSPMVDAQLLDAAVRNILVWCPRRKRTALLHPRLVRRTAVFPRLSHALWCLCLLPAPSRPRTVLGPAPRMRQGQSFKTPRVRTSPVLSTTLENKHKINARRKNCWKMFASYGFEIMARIFRALRLDGAR